MSTAQCGGRALAYDRRDHLLCDAPIGGRATVLVWWRRIRCTEPACPVRTWTERSVVGGHDRAIEATPSGHAESCVTRRPRWATTLVYRGAAWYYAAARALRLSPNAVAAQHDDRSDVEVVVWPTIE